ncbi:hypothetical protein BDQ12DRAFT_613977 [Crucibulum laeve]|uniref:glycerol-3-phosphate dehydrogenase n=1 Tax=Crucibulum laeve TaxID=68775 RepID=A0A5C3LNB9_9AGAR|nr:hypothetical protein BDQ12DRAFT_613977 [Crucibulum laeve]
MYNVLTHKENMETRYVMSKGEALEMFPILKSDGLVGAVIYYDGDTTNESRINIALIMSAVKHSAVAASYCEVTKLDKDDNDKLNCAHVKDTLISDECDVRAQARSTC